MKPYFIYKEKNSRDMGISILKLPPRIKPERRGEIINVPGRDGFLFESDDAYNNKTIIKNGLVTSFSPWHRTGTYRIFARKQ